jgi:hypothetical protein
MTSDHLLSYQLSLLIKASLGGKAALSSLSDVDDNTDWETLVELSKWHQVTALLFEYVEATENNGIPAPVFQELRQHGMDQAVFNMLFLKKSVELDADLKASGVSAFLMKGALWAWMLYENPGLREFGDVDFFLKKEQIKEGLEVMSRHGFEPDRYRKYLLNEDKIAGLYFDTDYQLPLTPVGNSMLQSLEVQWNTTYPRYHYSFSWEELMDDTVFFEISGDSLQVPGVENQLLMMIIHHAGVEQWDKLKFMGDLVRILRKFGAGMNWNYISDTARKKGFHKLLLESLGLVYVFTGENYLHFCGDNLEKKYPSQKFLKKVLVHWENKRDRPVTKSWQIFYFNMIYRDRLSDKLSILFSHLAYLFEWKLILTKARWYRARS